MKKETLSIIWLLVISFVFVLVFSNTTSPILYGRYAIDQQIFYYMGYSILSGKVPYLDIFDHKGLIVYFINAFGLSLHHIWGIFILQVVSLFFTTFLWYKSMLHIHQFWLKLLICTMGIFCLMPFYCDGAMTEEWSLPFITYPFYAYYKKEHHGEIFFSKLSLILMGLCLGFLSMIRLNNMAPALGVILFATWDAIKAKNYKYLLSSIGFVIIGASIPILSCCIYMIGKAGFAGIDNMVFGNILFNIEYSQNFGTSESPSIIDRIRFLYKPLLPIIFVPLFVRKEQRIIIPILLGTIIGLATMGKVMFTHYLIILTPLMVYSFMALVNKKILIISIGLVFAIYSKFYINHYYNFIFSEEDHKSYKVQSILDKIPQDGVKSVWNYNAPTYLYEMADAGIVQNNRVLLPMQIDLSKRLKKEEYCKLEKSNPSYVFLVKYSDETSKYLFSYSGSKHDLLHLERHYQIIANDIVNNGDTILLYKTKITN